MTHATRIALVVAALALAAPCPVSGQGVGTPGSNGLVPRIDFTHRSVGIPNTLRLHGFPAGAPIALALSSGAAALPLAPLGLGPAVLGPDLGLPDALFLQGLVADADGVFEVPLVLPFDAAFAPLHIQAAAPDPGAPFGGWTVSEHRRMRFWFEREAVPFALADGQGGHTLMEVFPDGVAAAPVPPELLGISFGTLALANENEMRPGRRDRPVPAPHVPGANRLLLPDGAALHLVQGANGTDGLVLVRPDGRIEPLLFAAGVGGDPAIEPEIAASPFAPLVAFASENGIAALGGARLFLARVDGWNVSGALGKVVALPSPPGLEIEGCSLCFLDGALFFGDGESELWRHDLATGLQTRVALVDASGAFLPYVDETCAPAADGSALAIGAGQSELLHDVWVVQADGTAFDLTGLPADYEDSGPGSANGIQLAMSPDGSEVVYMRTVIENEAFARGTAPGAPERHLTHPTGFIDSIDTVIGVGWRAGKAFFAAGQGPASVDYYRGEPAIPGVVPVFNITASSGFTAPVFDVGATLQHLARFSTPEHLVSIFADGGGTSLVFVDQAGAALEVGASTAPTVAARDGGGTLIADHDAGGGFRLRLVPDVAAATPQTLFTSAQPATVIGAGRDRDGAVDAWMIADAAGEQLVYVDALGSASTAPGPTHAVLGPLHVDGQGRVLALTEDAAAQLRYAERFDPQTGAWSVVYGPTAATSLGVFLR